jgi:hypothetical protein
MAKATKKGVAKATRAAVPAAKYPRASVTRVVPVKDAAIATATADVADEELATAKPVVAVPTPPKRPAPAVNVPKAATKAPVAEGTARAAAAVKAGKKAARAAGQPMVARRTLIRAENFGYVLKDLRIIGAIAVVMVIILLVLRFVMKG